MLAAMEAKCMKSIALPQRVCIADRRRARLCLDRACVCGSLLLTHFLAKNILQGSFFGAEEAPYRNFEIIRLTRYQIVTSLRHQAV